jgi:hypothetical protein
MPAGADVDLGLYYRISGLSAGVLNADLVPAMDVSNYKWLSVYVNNNAYSGTLTWQGSFDSTDSDSWKDLKIYTMTDLEGAGGNERSTSSTNVILGCPVWFPYFRVRMTSYTSGTAQGVLQLHTDGLAGFQLVNTAVYLNPMGNYFGFSRNDGVQSVPIASGHAADTVVNAAPGMLSSILVTAQNTHQMTIYDNASTASGTIIGVIPANQAVDGKPFVLRAPTANGIYVAGDANNPGVTIYHATLFS